MLPSFLIIGAQKSGTTSLYRYFSAHPETVVPSTKKEVMFFRSEEFFRRGVEWYSGLFRGPGSHAYEASVAYTQRHDNPGVPERIHSVIPAVRMIYLLRDPIERIRSQYVHRYQARREPLPFSRAIRENDVYVRTSLYFWQLSAYLDVFPREQLRVVTTERLKREPRAVMSELAAFVGISDAFDGDALSTIHHRSDSKGRRSGLEVAVVRAIPFQLGKTAAAKLLMPLRQKVQPPTISGDDRAFLTNALADDVRQLRAWTGSSLDEWSV